MSKRTNTFIFILGATLFNILTTMICFLVLFVIYIKLVTLAGANDHSANGLGISAIFIGAIVSSFFIYRVTIKKLTKKFDMDKYFAPLFGPRQPPRKNVD